MVDDGELQQYDTEEGKLFMSELNKGYIPEPLRKKHPGKKLGVALEDKRKHNFIPPPPPKYVAYTCLLYTSPSPRDKRQSRMPSSA